MSFDDVAESEPVGGPADEPGDDALLTDRALLSEPALFDVEGTSVAMPRHLSPSSANLFDQCPRRWRHRYIERLVEPPGEEALVGTFAHRVLEVLLGEPPARRTQERAKAIAREIWPETANSADYRSLDLDEAASRAFRWKGWHAVAGLWTLEDPASIEVAATERQVTAEIGGVPFLGVVDRIDRCADGLVVTDYKSGRAPSRRFEQAKLSQVLLYAAAVTAADGEAPVRARLLYLGATIIEADATDLAVSEAVTALRATWDLLREAASADRFDPKPGPLCGWCPYASTCDEGLAELRQRYDQGRLRTDAPAAALVA